MKQRLAGKIIKHPDRYADRVLLTAYECSVRSLRKWYREQGHIEPEMYNYHSHMASRPFYEMMDDVDDIWKVNNHRKEK